MSDIISFIKTGVGAEIDNALSNITGYTFCKSVYEKANYNQILKTRFVEFMDFMEKYKSYFKEELFLNEHFVSGLALTYEEIMKQRHEWKRDRIFGIFLGFVTEKDKEKFEFEKMYHVLNLMSLEEILLLKKVYDRDKGHFRNNMRVFKLQNKEERVLYQFLNSLSIMIDEEHYLARRNSTDTSYMHDTRVIPLNMHYFLTQFGNSFISNLYSPPNNPQAFGLTP